MSGCDRVVIVNTQYQGGKTSVTWLAFQMTGLTGFNVTLSQSGQVETAQAAADATSAAIDFVAKSDCVASVTPTTAEGPSEPNASFKTPVPFPPTPIDPAAGRPLILRTCSDGTKVSVNWLASTIPDLEGTYITITENGVSLENFDVEGADVVAAVLDYVCAAGSLYSVTLTPYDVFGLDPSAVSITQPIPYPAAGAARER